MGSSVKASCKCGYEQEFAIGGGMMSFQNSAGSLAYVEDANALSRRTSYKLH